ncbi:pollen-specific leucine-rich repeat extensin-like protein 3 isoform X3 [Archocentrus centrarchus]|uniref:pollen-specific leucine-rich repeat extensin-like protein 3 isoform X3 n=1 Tax=Archocentrus centrarchus TaxID=63155 RepID=UPI0011E9FD7D|nr:pollen-specific leucine-rich repeat extensin-like protein 3 isoform X3 [Archocentrus centrarchus]
MHHFAGGEKTGEKRVVAQVGLVPRLCVVPLLKNSSMASVPPPPPAAPLISGKLPQPQVHSPPRPQHAAIPIPPEVPPVQETDGSSPAVNDHSEDGTSHEPSDGPEEKKPLPVQETDPAPQALGQQTSESRVPSEANGQTVENGEEHLS